MDDIVELLSTVGTALGTISTAALAAWFGLVGNKQTRFLIDQTRNELDKEFFEFLTSIPFKIRDHLDGRTGYGGKGDETSRKYISFYTNKILDKAFLIGKRKLKKYQNYIDLAMKYTELVGRSISDSENDKKIFYQIKEEAKKLSIKVDSQTKLEGMRKLWEHESQCFWEQNIFLVQHITLDGSHLNYLVYSTHHKKDDNRSCQEASKIVQEHFNNKFSIKDNGYISNNKDTCEIIYPSHYELINRTDKAIEIWLNGEQIKLDYRKPRKLSRKLSSVFD